jgi:CubicO group peptidase (beta-lactamase class C family)
VIFDDSSASRMISLRRRISARTIALLALLLVAPLTPARNAGAAPAAAAEATAVNSASAVLDLSVAQKIDARLRDAVTDGRNSAYVLVYVADGKVQLTSAAGVEDPSGRVAVTTAQSSFAIGSVSKTFVAVALAQLKNRGQIASYADPAGKYLPGLVLPSWNGQAISIEQLASHSAGLDEDVFNMQSLTPRGGVPTPEDYRTRMPLLFAPPGSSLAYSGFGIDLLGLAIADVSHLSYSQYVQGSILQPLGMTATLVGYPREGIIPHQVRAFQPTAPQDLAEVLYARPVSYPSSGVMTTADDMGRYIAALLDMSNSQSVVTRGMQTDMFATEHSDVAGGASHSLVFEINHFASTTVVKHRGRGSGIGCMLTLVPQERTGIFYCLANALPAAPGTPAAKLPLDPDVVDNELLGMLSKAANAANAATGAGSTPSQNTGWQDEWNDYLGTFVFRQRHYFGIGRLRSLLHAQVLHIRRSGDSLLVDEIGHLIEKSPDHFEVSNSPETLIFYRQPNSGRLMLSRPLLAFSYDRPGVLEIPSIAIRVMAVFLALAATTLIWPLWLTEGGLLSKLIPPLFGLSTLAIPVVLFGLHAFGTRYFVGVGWPLFIVRVLGFSLIPLSAAMTLVAAQLLRGRNASTTALAKLHIGILAVDSWLSIAFLVYIGVIGTLIR